MTITKDTLLKDILDEYPQLYTILPEAVPQFGIINNPIGKALIKKMTMKDLADRSGHSVEELTQLLAVLLGDGSLG